MRFVFHEIRQPMNCVVLGAPNAAAAQLLAAACVPSTPWLGVAWAYPGIDALRATYKDPALQKELRSICEQVGWLANWLID